MRYTPCFADPANLVTPEEPPAPDGETALALLQAVYRDQRQPLHVRLRCATEALPYEPRAYRRWRLPRSTATTSQGRSIAPLRAAAS